MTWRAIFACPYFEVVRWAQEHGCPWHELTCFLAANAYMYTSGQRDERGRLSFHDDMRALQAVK